jgi:hypothetical protein
LDVQLETQTDILERQCHGLLTTCSHGELTTPLMSK